MMPKPIENQFILIGHLSSSHGIEGSVLMVPTVEAANPELFDDVDLVRLQNERGDLIPARIESVRVQEKDNRLSFFVKFEHINDRNSAESVKGSPVLAERRQVTIEPEFSWRQFTVVADGETVGQIDNVIDNPAHPILKVSTVDGMILVPTVDEYVERVDEKDETIYCKNLERLKRLNDDAH